MPRSARMPRSPPRRWRCGCRSRHWRCSRLLVAMRQPGVITGNMQVQADLHGTGATPHAIAATLDGSLGLAMANGTVDNRLLGSTLGSILRQVNLLDLVGRGGTSQIQCFAAHLDASHGIATVRSLVFASSLLTMDGERQRQPWRRDPRSAHSAAGEGCRHRCRRAVADQRAVPLAGRRARRRGGHHRECRNRGGCPAGQHDAAGTGRRRAGREATVSGRDDRLRRCPRRCPRCAGRQARPPRRRSPRRNSSQKPPNLGGVLKQLFR